MFDWIRRLFPNAASPPKARKPKRPRVRPQLEVLEDRTVPAMVMNINDDGVGSLRDAINTAANNSTIDFNANLAGQTIDLSSVLTIKDKNLKIDGEKLNITIAGINTGPNTCRIFNLTGNSSVEIDNLWLVSGKASQNDNGGNGGAIYDNAVNLTLNGDNFLQNQAQGDGGAVYTEKTAGPLTVTNCNFSYNTAKGSGGAIDTNAPGENVVVKNTIFTTNVAGSDGAAGDGDGGAIDAEGDAPTQLQLYTCTFQGNHTNSGGSGGAVYTTDQFQDSLSIYTNNYAQEAGGAIYWRTSVPVGIVGGLDNLSVSYDTFTSNQAGQGGGMFVFSDVGPGGRSTQNIWGCLFNNNTAVDNTGQSTSPYEGGGLAATERNSETGNTYLNVYNSTFYANNANGPPGGNGGGIYLLVNATGAGDDITRFFSLTVYQNAAADSGGGLYVDPASNFGANNAAVPQLLNDIIAGNTYNLNAERATGPDISGSVFTSGYNLIGATDGSTVVNNGGAWSGKDIVGTLVSRRDPGLDPNGLANNGGSTLTIKPVKGVSEAIGNGPRLSTLGGKKVPDAQLDQRGYQQQKSYKRADPTTIGAYDFNAKLAQQGQTSTTVVSSVNPSQVEQPVTFTATVSDDLDEGIPTGTVTFLDGDTVLGTATLDDNGNATYTTSTLALGVHTITADYGGDGPYLASSGTLTQIVSQETGNSSVYLTSSLNPAAPGQAVTFTANVSGDSGIPTGTVTFLADNDVLGTATLDGNDNATFTTSTLPLGSHTITVIYNGDGTYSSNSASLTQVIALVGSTTYLTSDGSPQPGDPVTFTANVFVNNGDTPSGTVTFLNGTAIMGTAPLSVVNGQGQATFTTSFGTGIYTITAVYSGDHEFLGSSGSMVQSVGDPTTSVTSLLLGSSSFPSLPGQEVTFTAMLTWSGPTTPTGTVTFLDGTTVLGTAPVDASGNAEFTTSTLSTGDHVITAVYSGDGTYSGSAFSAIQSVAASAATTTLTSSANPSQ
ncbi:MAG TPA: Ig-like domain repeat protein, partial [Gemmataceae bacterium]